MATIEHTEITGLASPDNIVRVRSGGPRSYVDILWGTELAGGGAGDATPPTVSFVPAGGTTIDRASPITVDVTDAGGLQAALLLVEFPATGAYEVVHDGAKFGRTYAGSSRSAITDGWRYTIIRTGGWPFSPTFNAIAVDTSGNET